MNVTIPRNEWSGALRRFSDRNAGRDAVLEVDDHDLGAQPVVEFPLWGVSYDPTSRRVEFRFSDFVDVTSHVSHYVEDVTAIELLVEDDEDARDTALRIGHGPGEQTLLHLPRHHPAAA